MLNKEALQIISISVLLVLTITVAQVPTGSRDIRVDSFSIERDPAPPNASQFQNQWDKGQSLAAVNEANEIYFPVITRPPIDLKELITRTTITLPQLLYGTSSSYCTWGGCGLGPRLYHEPLPDDRTLLGWSDLDIHDLSSDGHVSVISGEVVEQTFDFEGLSVRGLTAHQDDSFAVLLWDKEDDIMYLSKRGSDGGEIWTTNLNSSIAVADFAAGDGRLTYGNGLYGAYFTVYGVSGGVTGHHGDQLTYVTDDGVKQPGGWNFGCSHSMAELISYHPGLDQFLPVCSSDCNKIGILTNRNEIVYKGDGDCAGLVSTQLGQVALGVDSWLLVFNAMDRPCCEGKGVALATIDASYQSSLTWLTDTTGLYEADPSLARLGADLNLDRYLVGWMTTNDDVYYLGVVDGEGSFIVSPQAVSSAGVIWGFRDDSFRTRFDGSVSWVDGYHVTNLTNEIHFYRFDASIFNSP